MQQYLHGQKSIFYLTLGGNFDTRQAELKDIAGVSHVHLSNEVFILGHLSELCDHRPGGFVDLAKEVVYTKSLEAINQVRNFKPTGIFNIVFGVGVVATSVEPEKYRGKILY